MTLPPEPLGSWQLAERRRRQAAATRRRRVAMFVLAAGAAVAGAIVGSRADGGDEPVPAAMAPACPPEIVHDPQRLAGQALIVRMEDTATPTLKRAARRGEIGGVVLFPTTGTPTELAREIAALRGAAAAGGAPPPLVMVDQEGGEVKRLPSLPPDRAPAQIGADAVQAERQGRAAGRALARLGVDVDLAPVLDVPATDASFIASRAFADDPEAVRSAGAAFAAGLNEAGVAATAKHFPGLGLAATNTDEAPVAIDASRTELEPGLRAFTPTIEAPLSLVMVANASYRAYDARRPASLSSKVIGGLLRDELGFDGVVITDDLGAGAIATAGIGEGEAAVAAARAGADLLLFALSDGQEARAVLVRAIRRRRLDREVLLSSCARVTRLRAELAG